jgi:hypothetical protein
VSTFWEFAYDKSLGAFQPNARIEKLSNPSGVRELLLLLAIDKLLPAKVEPRMEAVLRQKDLRDFSLKIFFTLSKQFKKQKGASLKRWDN